MTELSICLCLTTISPRVFKTSFYNEEYRIFLWSNFYQDRIWNKSFVCCMWYASQIKHCHHLIVPSDLPLNGFNCRRCFRYNQYCASHDKTVGKPIPKQFELFLFHQITSLKYCLYYFILLYMYTRSMKLQFNLWTFVFVIKEETLSSQNANLMRWVKG